MSTIEAHAHDFSDKTSAKIDALESLWWQTLMQTIIAARVYFATSEQKDASAAFQSFSHVACSL